MRRTSTALLAVSVLTPANPPSPAHLKLLCVQPHDLPPGYSMLSNHPDSDREVAGILHQTLHQLSDVEGRMSGYRVSYWHGKSSPSTAPLGLLSGNDYFRSSVDATAWTQWQWQNHKRDAVAHGWHPRVIGIATVGQFRWALSFRAYSPRAHRRAVGVIALFSRGKYSEFLEVDAASLSIALSWTNTLARQIDGRLRRGLRT